MYCMFYIDKDQHLRRFQKDTFSTTQELYTYLWKQMYDVDVSYIPPNLDTKKGSIVYLPEMNPFCLYKKKYNINVTNNELSKYTKTENTQIQK